MNGRLRTCKQVTFSQFSVFCIALIVSLCFGIFQASDAVSSQAIDTAGIYSLSKSFLDVTFTLDYVTGISVRAGWDEIEPEPGVYDWSYFDSLIQTAASTGKKVMIRAIAGKFTPSWVYEKGAVPYTFDIDGEMITMPLPWDSTYLKEWTAFIAELGERYSREPNVVLVHMNGPSAGGEMYLPDDTNKDFWYGAGYSRSKLTRAWKTVIYAYAVAFPYQALALNVSRPLLIGDSLRVVNSTISYGYSLIGDRLRVQGNWLSASTSEKFVLYQKVARSSNYINVGFQMVSSASDPTSFGGSLRQAIDKALNAGASYLEIYSADIYNPNYAEDFEYADYYLRQNQR